MEIDIKKMWAQQFVKEEQLDKGEIEKRLKMKSKTESVLKNLKRKFIIEIVGVLICIIICLLAILYCYQDTIFILSLLATVILLGVLIFLFFVKYKNIYSLTISQNNIKDSLSKIIIQLKQFITIYVWGGLTAGILALFIGVFTGVKLRSLRHSGQTFFDFTAMTPLKSAQYILLFLLGLIFTFFVVKLMIKILYSKPLKKLQQYYNEITTIENDEE